MYILVLWNNFLKKKSMFFCVFMFSNFTNFFILCMLLYMLTKQIFLNLKSQSLTVPWYLGILNMSSFQCSQKKVQNFCSFFSKEIIFRPQIFEVPARYWMHDFLLAHARRGTCSIKLYITCKFRILHLLFQSTAQCCRVNMTMLGPVLFCKRIPSSFDYFFLINKTSLASFYICASPFNYLLNYHLPYAIIIIFKSVVNSSSLNKH